MKHSRTPRYLEALLVFSTLAAGLLIAEIGYRVFQYVTLPGRIIALSTASAGPGAYVFDPHTGYRYKPNRTGEMPAPYNSRWRSNSYGHISAEEYPRKKPSDEYRIAVIGDSFTAAITSNVRWTEVLSDRLNASTEWRSFTSGRATRVINLGIDGVGFVQFAGASQSAGAFEPDFVIINFVMDDFWRRMTYRSQPQNADDINQYVRQRFLAKVDWFSLRSELIAATVGQHIGMTCAIPIEATEYVSAALDVSSRYSTRAEAMDAGRDAIKSILTDFPNAIFLHAPLKIELQRNSLPEWLGFLEELTTSMPEFRVVSMAPAFGDGPERLFIPRDGHYSDDGNKLYGEAVARLLIEGRSPGNPKTPL